MGSIRKIRMFTLDFEVFYIQKGINEIAIGTMENKFENIESLSDGIHDKMMD